MAKVNKSFLPLPPGMVPSDSRENMLDVLSETSSPRKLQEVMQEDEKVSNKENVVIADARKDISHASRAWSHSTVGKEMASLSLSSNKKHPTYHIDLNSEVKGDGGESGTTKVKISGPTWSPMRRKNKVAPILSPKQHSTPLIDQKRATPRSNERLRRLAVKQNDEDRPSSAPSRKIFPVTGFVLTEVGSVEGLVEIHSSFKGSTPDTPPIYSEVVKCNRKGSSNDCGDQDCAKTGSRFRSPSPPPIPPQPTSPAPEPPQFGDEEKTRYIQDLVTMSPNTFSSPIKRATSATSSIVQTLQDKALADKDNDSLYDSMLEDVQNDGNDEESNEAGQYSEITNLDRDYIKGLRKQDFQDGVKLISVQGVTGAQSGQEMALPSQRLPPDMQAIHYASATGDKKGLEGILSLLPITQDPVEMVLGSTKFRVREGINVRDGEGRTPLMHAVYNGHIGCVRLLAEAGANVNIESEDGSTCLHHAAFTGSSHMLALLLSLGADGLKQDMEGRVPLHWAANNEDSQAINILLDKVPGLGPNVRDSSKMTPLMWAGYYGQSHNIDTLRKRGADSTLSDVDGMKAVHWSIKSGNIRALQTLLSPESSGYRDNRGRTVMHMAAEQGFSRAIDMIRSTRPLSVNDQDGNRRSPLHWATVCEKPEAIRALTTAGADPALYDSKSMTALEYAIIRGLHYCGLLLAQAIEEGHDREAAIGYHNVLSVGQAASIGVRTLIQQEGRVNEVTIDDITDEQILQIKTVCTGGWLNKFTSNGKGPLHFRFFWIDPETMTINWSKSIESRYISSKDTRNDKLVGVRTSASSCILHRKDFDPLDKHKYTFTIFTNSKVLDMVALSSDDYKIWLNGIQLLLNLGSEVANELMNGRTTRTE